MTDKEPETMTLTQGLSQIKLLTKRLTSTLADSMFISASRGMDKTTIHNIDVDDMRKRCQSDYDSARDLIARRTAIKQAIVAANARERVTIGDTSYTIAEAIERKSSIELEKQLLNAMRAQLAGVQTKVDRANEVVELNLQKILEHLGQGPDGEAPTVSASEYTEQYRSVQEFKFVDPIKLADKISKLQEEVDTFEADVDTALSINNATVFITLG